MIYHNPRRFVKHCYNWDHFRQELQDDRVTTYIRTLKDIIQPELQMVVCIVPNNRKDRYDAIKKTCCLTNPSKYSLVIVWFIVFLAPLTLVGRSLCYLISICPSSGSVCQLFQIATSPTFPIRFF